MSTARAIAAVTATMRSLLEKQVPIVDDGLSELKVTVGPPDLTRKGISSSQINLFLYQVVTNAAWANQDLPFQVRPGETAPPPLALNLHFLLTVYGSGETDNGALSLRVLGGAMIVLHSHPLLGRQEIVDAMPDSELDHQIERIRISSLPLGVEELSKLWTIFQTPYRTSVAYEATVVLIDSRRSAPAPLPVLKRGEEDRGAFVMGQLAPQLGGIEVPNSQPAIRLGEEFGLAGGGIGPTDIAVLTSPQLEDEITIEPLGYEGGALRFRIAGEGDDPQAMSRWFPGFFTVALRRPAPDNLPPISSNALSLALAPTVKVTVGAIAAGTVNLTVECAPRIRPGQRVVLIFGDRQVPVNPESVVNPPDEAKPTGVTVAVPDVSAGSYVVRLRVDGVDSIPVVRESSSAPPSFDENQTVVVP